MHCLGHEGNCPGPFAEYGKNAQRAFNIFVHAYTNALFIDFGLSLLQILPRRVTTGNKMADLLSTSPIWTTIWTRNTEHDNQQLAAHGTILEHFFDILDIIGVGRNPRGVFPKSLFGENKKTKLSTAHC